MYSPHYTISQNPPTSQHQIQEGEASPVQRIAQESMVMSRVASEKIVARDIIGRKVEPKISGTPLGVKERFLKEFKSALTTFSWPSILDDVINEYAMELATYPDLLLGCFSEFEGSCIICDRRGSPKLNPCYATQSSAFLGRIIKLISEKQGAEFIEAEHFLPVRTHIATTLKPALPMIVGNHFFSEEIRLAEICGLNTTCYFSMNRVGNLSEMPINFIWFGGVLPDRYIANVQKWNDLYPSQKIILWFDKRLLDSNENGAMMYLEEITPNLHVLDISDAGFDDLDNLHLNDHFKNLLDKILLHPNKDGEEGIYYVTASDLLRYALMIKQGDAINTAFKARGQHEGISNCGMIYFDTDIFASNVRGFLPDCPMEHGLLHDTLSWTDALADIDTLAANSCGIEFFKATLSSALDAHLKSPFAQNKSSVPDWTLSSSIVKNNKIKEMLLSGNMPTDEFSSKIHFPFLNISNDGDRSWDGGRDKISQRTLVKRYKEHQSNPLCQHSCRLF